MLSASFTNVWILDGTSDAMRRDRESFGRHRERRQFAITQAIPPAPARS